MKNIIQSKDWEIQKGNLIKKLACLTNNELLFTKDRQEEIFGPLVIKLGKSKDDIQKILNG